MFTSLYKLLGGKQDGQKRDREEEFEVEVIGMAAPGDDLGPLGAPDPNRVVDLSAALASLKFGENAAGRGPLAFLKPRERGNFGLASKELLEFKKSFRAPLRSNPWFEVRGADEMIRFRSILRAYNSPLRLRVPRDVSDEEFEILRGRRIPEVEINHNSQLTDKSMSAIQGVRRLIIMNTFQPSLITDAALLEVKETLEELESVHTRIRGEAFSELRRLRILKFRYDGRYGELEWKDLPPSLEELSASGTEQLGTFGSFILDKSLRLPNLRKLKLSHFDSVTTFPASVQELLIEYCPNIDLETFRGRYMKQIKYRDGIIPQPEFVEDLELLGPFDMEEHITELRQGLKWEFPDCERLTIWYFGGMRLSWFVRCKSLRRLEVEFSEFVDYDEMFWENLRELCPNLVDVIFGDVRLWFQDEERDLDRNPAELGFVLRGIVVERGDMDL